MTPEASKKADFPTNLNRQLAQPGYYITDQIRRKNDSARPYEERAPKQHLHAYLKRKTLLIRFFQAVHWRIEPSSTVCIPKKETRFKVIGGREKRSFWFELIS